SADYYAPWGALAWRGVDVRVLGSIARRRPRRHARLVARHASHTRGAEPPAARSGRCAHVPLRLLLLDLLSRRDLQKGTRGAEAARDVHAVPPEPASGRRRPARGRAAFTLCPAPDVRAAPCVVCRAARAGAGSVAFWHRAPSPRSSGSAGRAFRLFSVL